MFCPIKNKADLSLITAVPWFIISGVKKMKSREILLCINIIIHRIKFQ